ncbi:olfactory receptor 56A5-like [Pleurodeles waltl]|uniref:olfactory receptor 56A5-like n=1 Tax=Pleurodeles waltl TaxID=8319 RepID=UPI0037094940
MEQNRSSGVLEFVLICFPGIEHWQHWLSIPIVLFFLLVVATNATLIATIYSSPSLHQPLYYLLFMLALVDLVKNFTLLPKSLAILWFNENRIIPFTCFSQVFILGFCTGMEASVFTGLAYDRYIAICHPLHHSSIITNRKFAEAASVSLIVNAVIFLPFPLLSTRQHYCGDTIKHCFCENLPLAKLACDSSRANYIYSLVILSAYMMVLSLSLTFSYGMILRAVLRLSTSRASKKAFHTCSSHLILICINYVILILNSISNRMEDFIPRYIHVLLSIFKVLAQSFFNPFVYGIKTKEIRQEIKRLFRWM